LEKMVVDLHFMREKQVADLEAIVAQPLAE